MEMEQMEYTRQIFREIALTLAGIISLYEVEDNVVKAITQGVLDVFESYAAPDEFVMGTRPHPAVTEMLDRIEGDSNTKQ